MENDVFVPSWMKDEDKRSTSAPSDFTPAWAQEETPVPEAPKQESRPSSGYSLPGDNIEEWGTEVYTPEPRQHPTAKESNETFSKNIRSTYESVLGPALGGLAADVTGGVWNIPRNVVETGLMVREALTDRSGDVDTFNEAIPNYRPRPEDGVGQILTTGTELVGGISSGAKIGREVLQNAGPMAQKAGAVVGGLFGEGAAVDEDSDTLALGKNSALGLNISPGSVFENDNQGAEGISKKVDIMVDSMAAGAAVKFGARAGEYIFRNAASILDSTFSYLNKARREDKVAAEAIYKMADISKLDTEQQVAEKMQKLSDNIFSNNNMMKDFVEKNPGFLDTLPEGEKAKLLETINIQRDAARSLESAGASPASIDAARSIRKGIQDGSDAAAVQVREGLAEPVKRLEGQMDEIYQSGRGNLDDTAAAVRTEAEDRSQRYLDRGREAREAFEARKDSVNELTKDSPELRSRVESISKNVDLDTSKSVRSSSEELAAGSREASKLADENYKKALQEIPDDIFVDKDEITKILGENEGLINRLDEKFIRGVMNEDDALYKNLLEDGSKSISRAIDTIERTGNGTRRDVEDLQKIRKILREDPKAAYPDYAKQLEDAEEAYKTWANVNKQGSVRDFRDSGRQNRFQEVDRNVEDLKISKDAAKDAYKAEHLRDVLSSVGKEGNVDKVVMDLAFERLRSSTNKTGDVSLKSLVDSVKQIEKGTLSPKMQGELEDVLTKLRDRQVGLKAEEKLVRRAETEANQKSQKVFRNDFKEFFKDTSEGLKPRGNTKKAFDEVFSGDDNMYKVRDVIEAVRKDGTKEAQDGLKAGYIDSFRKKFIDKSKEGSARVKTDDIDEMLKYGDEIFGESDGTMKILKALSDESTAASKSQTSDALRIGKSSKEARAAILKGVANLVTMRYGPLSRTGARINTVSSRIADILHPEETSKFLSDLITDTADGGQLSQHITKMMNQIAKDKAAADNPTILREIGKYLVKANLRTPTEVDEFFDYRFKDSLIKD